VKSRTGILTLVGLIAAGGLFYGLSGAPKHASEPTGENQKLQGEVTTQQTRSAGAGGSLLTLRSMIESPVRKNPKSVARLSEECAALENTLFSLSLTDLDYPPKIKKLPSTDGCSPSDPKIAKTLKFYSRSCEAAINTGSLTGLSKEEWKEKFSDCQYATLILRSTLAAAERGEKPLKDIEDMRELADLLIASFGQFFTDFSAARMKEMTAVADRMAELDPRLQVAVKAGVMSETMKSLINKDARSKGDADVETPDWADLQKRLARAEEIAPNDTELSKLKRVIDTEGMDPERVKQDSLNRVSKNPNDWQEQQILAWANFKQGRRDEARAALLQALKADPGNVDLKENLVVVNRRDSKPDDFKITMKIGINFNDLLQ